MSGWRPYNDRMRRLIGLFLATVTTATAGDNVDKMDAAREQLRAGHTDAAIGILQQQLAKDPAAVAASILLTETLLAAERFDEADQATENALAKNKSEAGLDRVLGDLRFREGRIFDAEKAYKAAIRLDAHNARAIYGVSRVFDAASFRKKASEMLQVAHAIDPQDPMIASAFDEAASGSPAVLARREAELAVLRAKPGGEPGARQRALERWIAMAKALDGKPAFEPAAPDRPYGLPLGRLMDGRRLTGGSLPIKINGVKADLRFDTGAGGITLGSRFAERAGVKRLADGEISGIGNGPAVKGWVGYAPAIQIGGLTLEHCIVQVPEKGSTDDSGGLIGSDLFPLSSESQLCGTESRFGSAAWPGLGRSFLDEPLRRPRVVGIQPNADRSSLPADPHSDQPIHQSGTNSGTVPVGHRCGIEHDLEQSSARDRQGARFGG